MFCATCFCEEHLKLNFSRFALAFNRLACPWVEQRPPTHKLRAQHLLTTVESTFPWSSSFHTFINTCCLQLFKSFTDKWNRQTIVDHLLKYMCPSLNEWRLIKPCLWPALRERNWNVERVGRKWEIERRADSRAGKEMNWIKRQSR